MIAFEVQKNGQTLCTAGVTGLGVVFVMTRWITRQEPEGIERLLDVEVFGQSDAVGKLQQWANEPLKLGDEVLIRVVAVNQADPAKIG